MNVGNALNGKVSEVGMRLTDEMIQEDNKRFKRQNLLAEFNYCGKEVPKRKSITNDDIRFYAWLCRSSYTLLKEQESEEKRILKIVWDILHSGVSTDTKADQDWVYEQIRNRVRPMYDEEPKQVGLYGKEDWYGLVCVCQDCGAEWMSEKDETNFCPKCGTAVKRE